MESLAILAATGDIRLWPFFVLGIAVVFVVVSISRFRLHPFLALLSAAILVGLMAEQLPGARPRNPTEASQLVENTSLVSHWRQAVELTMQGLGQTAGSVAASIALASIIGMCLMESGGADKVVRRFLAVFGEKHAALALLASTYVLAIPMFFDTLFMLMVPLAKALQLRTGRDYLLYLLCICCSGVIMHSMTVPHPGPLAAVEYLNLEVGWSILAGIAAGIPPAIGGYFVSCWINRRMNIPLRNTPGTTLGDLQAIVKKPESELPGFAVSLIPVLLPIVLITSGSFLVVWQTGILNAKPWALSMMSWVGGEGGFQRLFHFFEFFGNKNIALILGVITALLLVAHQKGYGWSDLGSLLGPPLETAGVIILITSAGGAFGLMLRSAGVGDAIKAVAEGYSINLILLAYTVALVIRIAQGSATVAMLTTAAMVQGMLDPGSIAALPFHPMYLFLAIGFGAFGASWMNDSGFWVVSRLGGMTEKETLRSWTVMLTCSSVFGLITTLVISWIFPCRL